MGAGVEVVVCWALPWRWHFLINQVQVLARGAAVGQLFLVGMEAGNQTPLIAVVRPAQRGHVCCTFQIHPMGIEDERGETEVRQAVSIGMADAVKLPQTLMYAVVAGGEVLAHDERVVLAGWRHVLRGLFSAEPARRAKLLPLIVHALIERSIAGRDVRACLDQGARTLAVHAHRLEAVGQWLPAIRCKFRQVIPAALANLIAVLAEAHKLEGIVLGAFAQGLGIFLARKRQSVCIQSGTLAHAVEEVLL
jgi:hypothetical protein